MAPPANDNFANAITISGASGTQAGTVFDATREGTESSTLFGGTVARSVWYKWTCPASGWYKFWIPADDFVRNGAVGQNAFWCGMDLFNDGVLTAHTNTASLAQSQTIANEFDHPDSLTPIIAYNFTSGNVYYIRLASQDQLGINNYSSFDFVLNWDTVDAPANDLIANAIDIDPLPETIGPITTWDNTFQTGENTALAPVGTQHQSQWFKFTPTATGKYSIVIEHADVAKDNNDPTENTAFVRVRIGTISGTTFTIVSGSGNISYQLITDPPSTGRGAMYADLVSGTEYYILVVSGWDQKSSSFGYQFNSGTMSIDAMVVEQVVGPANDNFASPTALSTTLPSLLTGQTNLNAGPEAGENFPFTIADVQAVWYSFAPTHNGKYRFRLPVDSLDYAGDVSTSWGEVHVALTAATAVTGVTGSDFLPVANTVDSGYSDPGWINVHNPTIVADLTSGTTYRFICWSEINSSIFNRQVMNFDVSVDEIFAPSNNNFANRVNFTGASGTQAYDCTGASDEASEPYPTYWWEGALTNLASVWYDWTAPASDWYQFRVEQDLNSGVPSLGIYTGSAIGSLTPVARNEGGTMSAIDEDDGCTTIKFFATSGTNYKFQIAMQENTANSYGGTGNITWAAADPPEGDTTDFAVIGDFSETLVNNFGNTDDELPPDWFARLSAHGDWWYDEGQAGRSKWFKFSAPGNVTVRVEGAQYATAGRTTYSEYGLLAYKGNDYASLVDATTNESEDGIMYGYAELATTILNDTFMEFDLTTGEDLWLCMVGLFDMDVLANNASTAVMEVDCPQGEIHLTFSTGAPPNDDRSAVVNVLGNDPGTWLGLTQWTEYGDWFPGREAMQGIGTTFAASTQTGDPNIAGFTATRTVWYMVLIDKPGDWKFWVESAVDAVLGIYDYNGTSTLGTMIAEDDDSGPGNQPEILHTFSGIAANFKQYWVGIDTKTEGNFVFNCQRQSDGTPPANDDVADAVVISSVPFSQAGTTVDATCEPAEMDSVWLGTGPKDTVWYKFLPPANGQYMVYGTCDSNNYDGYVVMSVWKGTTVDNLEPMPEDVNNKGWFDNFDTLEENKSRALVYDYDAGQTYFIRVETEEGGSEDFTIYMDDAPIYINIQVSGSEEMHGTLLDDATVYVNIQASGSEIHHISQTTDSGTVLVDIQPGGFEILADEYIDSGTVYINIQNMGGECFSAHTGLAMDAEADPRWMAGADIRWQAMDVVPRWEIVDVQSEGVHC